MIGRCYGFCRVVLFDRAAPMTYLNNILQREKTKIIIRHDGVKIL